jgi:hypothetical protein
MFGATTRASHNGIHRNPKFNAAVSSAAANTLLFCELPQNIFRSTSLKTALLPSWLNVLRSEIDFRLCASICSQRTDARPYALHKQS